MAVESRRELVEIFGLHMKMARELSGYSQIRAAELLGYANSSKLAKVEAASDGNSIPFWLIHKAAEVYNVSADFLLGISDSWQRDICLAQQQQLEASIDQASAAEDNAVRALYERVSAISNAMVAVLDRQREIKAVICRFKTLNPEFEDMRLGAKLIRLIDEANREASLISKKLAGHHASSHLKT